MVYPISLVLLLMVTAAGCSFTDYMADLWPRHWKPFQPNGNHSLYALTPQQRQAYNWFGYDNPQIDPALLDYLTTCEYRPWVCSDAQTTPISVYQAYGEHMFVLLNRQYWSNTPILGKSIDAIIAEGYQWLDDWRDAHCPQGKRCRPIVTTHCQDDHIWSHPQCNCALDNIYSGYDAFRCPPERSYAVQSYCQCLPKSLCMLRAECCPTGPPSDNCCSSGKDWQVKCCLLGSHWELLVDTWHCVSDD